MTAEQRPTLLVVLGAGASLDCIPMSGVEGPALREMMGRIVRSPGLPDLPFRDVRPPVTQQLAQPGPLLDWTLGRWRWARPVIDHLRRSLPAHDRSAGAALTLEQALRDYQEGADAVPERRRHLLATRFYLQDLLWACTSYMLSPDITGGVTNQLTLLRHLLDWCRGDRCVVVVSFNYDLIFERAMESAWDFNPSMIGGYLAHDRIHLLKPHGSVQWMWPLIDNRSATFGSPLELAHASIGVALGDYEDDASLDCIANATFESSSNVTRRHLVPALALPITGKNEFIWPKAQQARLDSLQGIVTRVLTIGWRGMEDHFVPLLRPLVQQNAQILVVDGGPSGDSEAAASAERLQQHLDVHPDRWRSFGGGFSALLAPGSSELDWVLG